MVLQVCWSDKITGVRYWDGKSFSNTLCCKLVTISSEKGKKHKWNQNSSYSQHEFNFADISGFALKIKYCADPDLKSVWVYYFFLAPCWRGSLHGAQQNKNPSSWGKGLICLRTPRPMLTNDSYWDQLRDLRCRNAAPRWFSVVNHNKDKTNISHTSHVSLWGFLAVSLYCLHEGLTPASVPSELKMNWNRPFCLLSQQNFQIMAATLKHLLLGLVSIHT